MSTVVFGTSYLGSLEYYSVLVKNKNVVIDQYEWFVKQSIRNRCVISAPNGIQKLVVPYSHFGAEKIRVKELKINYSEAWHKYQLKCLNTAYNSSPFFEFYKDKLSTILLGTHLPYRFKYANHHVCIKCIAIRYLRCIK
ncbi:MAG: WbqC family protein [Bacteroidia bacterium]|nr:WbqC family protein [Bacteroidia bacterium]